MNTKEYIESGILEMYVFGNVTEAVRAEVEAAAAQYPEIQREIDAIEDSLDAYAVKHSVTPSEGTKQAVMNAVLNPGKGNLRSISIEDEERSDPRNNAIWSIAASVLLLLSLTINLYLYNRMGGLAKEVTGFVEKEHKDDSMLKKALVENKQMQSDLLVLKDPMYKIVELKGQEKTPDAKAMVCFCPGSKLVYFEADKMPEPPKGMQYQLWAMVDGKPIDEGMITMGNGLHKMKDIGSATAFAVTLEKEGGSDTPHGDMIVMGSI